MNVGKYLRGEDQHVGSVRINIKSDQEPIAFADQDSFDQAMKSGKGHDACSNADDSVAFQYLREQVARQMAGVRNAVGSGAEPVTWGVDWGTHGDQSCCTVLKVHPDGVREVVAVEYGPPYHTPQNKPITRATINQMMENAGWQNSSIRQADLDKVEKVVRAVEATLRQST